eukprot:m.19457 g.19457  ORF g.19457 m.19457 type:complete len:349 (+) comp5121_c0_seq2:1159-2205(+)
MCLYPNLLSNISIPSLFFFYLHFRFSNCITTPTNFYFYLTIYNSILFTIQWFDLDICLDRMNKRLFSVALDRMLKVYDVQNWNVVHSMKFSGHILSVGVSPGHSEPILAVGQSDGFLAVRMRTQGKGDGTEAGSGGFKQKITSSGSKKNQRPRVGSRKYFLRGQSRKPVAIDYKVPVARKRRLRPHDVHLKSFRYSDALDSVMNESSGALMKASVIYELVQREGMVVALSNRDDASLEPILSFVVKYITHPRYTKLLANVAQIILDIYAPGIGRSVYIDKLFKTLSVKLDAELRLLRDMEELAGAIDALIACNSVTNRSDEEQDAQPITTTTSKTIDGGTFMDEEVDE